jgi:hypothetical protein
MATYHVVALYPSIHERLSRHVLERKVLRHDGNPTCYWKVGMATMIDFLLNFYEVVNQEIVNATKAEAFTKRGVVELNFQDIFDRAIAYVPRKKTVDGRQTMKIALEDMIRVRQLFVTKMGFEPDNEILRAFAERVIRQERVAAKPLVFSDPDLPIPPTS